MGRCRRSSDDPGGPRGPAVTRSIGQQQAGHTVRHHPDDAEAIREARRALVVAQAHALRDEADQLEAGVAS